MGNLFCCEKMVNSKENLPMTNNYKAEVPLLSIELNKKSINNNGLETKTTSSNIEDHIFIDKTVIIGKGEGDNWWCVLFPPLCMIEAEEATDVEYTSMVKEIVKKYLK